MAAIIKLPQLSSSTLTPSPKDPLSQADERSACANKGDGDDSVSEHTRLFPAR